jgi:glycosyltransferase involved in cell wall biosynthesis
MLTYGYHIAFIPGWRYGNDWPSGFMKVLHIISGLGLGGAENMLKRLIESRSESLSDTEVISLTSLGVVGESLRNQGIRVHTLGMSSLVHLPGTMWRLIRLIQHFRPNVIQTWMYHADLIGGLAARLAGSFPVVWGVRSTSIPQGRFSVTYWLVRLCAGFSYCIPHQIICCASSAKAAHVKLGYAEYKMIVIPNGYNFSDFKYHEKTKMNSRTQLGINERDFVIGVVGRFDQLKDFHNFVSAAALVAGQNENIKFLMVGRDNDWVNATLYGWIKSAGLINRFYLVGQQTDVALFYMVMDVFCLSSVSEAFPNVVVEAMAMGLPCVVTRAGDAAIILDDEDYVVPVEDSAALANALLEINLLDSTDRKKLGDRNAEKVRCRYGINEILQKYAEVYELATKQR